MSLLLILPGLYSFFLVLRGRIETAFLSVYLPCLLCLPDEYSFRIPHLPPTSAAQFALIPLGVVGLMRMFRSGSFVLMDVLALLYAVSIGLSESLHSDVFVDGIFAAVNAFITVFLAYAAGRTLIEPGLRLATVRRFVILVLLDVPTGVWEWKFAQSPYGVFGSRVLGLPMPEYIRIRNGYGRMGVALGSGELAGIAYAMTFCLNSWLVYLRRVKASVDLGKILSISEKFHLIEMVLFLACFLTGSRGPLLSLIASLLILQIPRFKQTRILTLLVALVLVGGYLAATAYVASYVDVTVGASQSEQQSSAVYRHIMNEVYPPIAEIGGWTGYGALGIPTVQGMKSIDNQFLLVHLAWGKLGYYSFLLVVWENTRVLLVRTWMFKAVEDRAFMFAMLGAMAVLWFTLLTVFLGGQLPQIAFILIGWIQATGVSPKTTTFSYRRIFS